VQDRFRRAQALDNPDQALTESHSSTWPRSFGLRVHDLSLCTTHAGLAAKTHSQQGPMSKPTGYRTQMSQATRESLRMNATWRVPSPLRSVMSRPQKVRYHARDLETMSLHSKLAASYKQYGKRGQSCQSSCPHVHLQSAGAANAMFPVAFCCPLCIPINGHILVEGYTQVWGVGLLAR
jgi:hypothetical protein